MTAPLVTTRSVCGNSMSNDARSERSPTARPIPATTPTTDAIAPITSDSSTTARLTWRRVAPISRSVPSSRVRCATVIESVFTITNAPTKSTTPPKPRRTQVMMLTKRAMPALSASARTSAVCTCTVSDANGCSRLASAAALTPSSAATETTSSRPSLWRSRCATGRSKTAIVAPPSELTFPKRASPTTAKGAAGPNTAIRTASPTPIPCDSAVEASRTTSRSCAAQRPAFSRSGLKRSSCGRNPITNDGSPETLSPCASTTFAVGGLPDRSKMAPAASATPGTALIPSSIRAGRVGALDSDQSTTGFPDTMTSVRSYALAKTTSNERCIVAPSTELPVTIATPSTIASAVSSVRSFRARRPRSVRRVTAAPLRRAPGHTRPATPGRSRRRSSRPRGTRCGRRSRPPAGRA